MTGKAHAEIGIVTYIGICDKLPGNFSYIGIVVVGIASLFPDIDHPNSIFNKYILPIKNNATKVIVYVSIGLILLFLDNLYFNNSLMKLIGFMFIMIGFSSHREGITHSLLGMIIFTVIISCFAQKYKIPNVPYYFLIGYGMHLLGDMLTKRGVPIFYPFNKKKYKFPLNFSTGTKTAKIIEQIIMVVGLMYVIYKLPSILTYK